MAKVKNKNNFFIYVFVFLLGFMLALSLVAKENNNKLEEKQEINYVNDTSEILKGSANIVAVTRDNKGIFGKVEVEITQGNGKVLVNTNPFLEPDTQYSANIAAIVASNITNFDLNNKNVIYNFNIQGEVLGGGSAGLPMTLATIAAINKKEIKNIAMTGTILPSGEVGNVGAILEKGQATASQNVKTFLIPSGQGIFTYYERITDKKVLPNGVTLIRTSYQPKSANLTEYFDKEYNMKVVEIKNIQDAMKYAF